MRRFSVHWLFSSEDHRPSQDRIFLDEDELIKLVNKLQHDDQVVYAYLEDRAESRLAISGIDENRVALDMQFGGEAYDKVVRKADVLGYLQSYAEIENDPEAHGFVRDG